MSQDHMNPESSPAGPTAGTRRVNSWPIYILGGTILVFVGTVALVAANRAEKVNAPPAAVVEKATSSEQFAKDIAGERLDGVVPAATPPVLPPLGPTEPLAPQGFPVAAGQVPPLQPMGLPMSGGQASMGSQDPAERASSEERRQRTEAAMKAKSGVQFLASAKSSSGDPMAGPAPATAAEALARIAAARQQAAAMGGDPMAAYQARAAAVEAALKGRGIGSSGGQGGTLGSGGGDFLQTAAAGSSADRWKLDNAPEKPRSKFELRAGFVIPATLISGINSELPGQIVAQVSQNVWDTATGKYLLIPQGARLVGAYNNGVIYGQSRVLVAWQRIVFPDGKAMDIGAMPGADGAGYAGFTDQVNNHYVRIFGSALLMSGVIAGVTYSQGSSSGTSNSAPTASSAMSEALGQQLGQATSQLISKNLNIAPTLEIRPGYRFNVIAVKDLTFDKPYRSFDY